jgi:hypothetical protein
VDERENGRDESGPARAAAVLPLAAEPVEARGAFNDASTTLAELELAVAGRAKFISGQKR